MNGEKRGWWTLDISDDFELNDSDREHIASLVLAGFASGELTQDEQEIEEDSESLERERLESCALFCVKLIEKKTKEFLDKQRDSVML